MRSRAFILDSELNEDFIKDVEVVSIESLNQYESPIEVLRRQGNR